MWQECSPSPAPPILDAPTEPSEPVEPWEARASQGGLGWELEQEACGLSSGAPWGPGLCVGRRGFPAALRHVGAMTRASTARRRPLQCGHVPGTGWVCGGEPAGLHPHACVPSSSTVLAAEGAVRGPGPPLLMPMLLNALPHPNMYVLERVQHRVPEEALRVSAARRAPPPVPPSRCSSPRPLGCLARLRCCESAWSGLLHRMAWSGQRGVATPWVTQPQRRVWLEPERRFLGPDGEGVRKRTHPPGIWGTRRTLLLGGGRQGRVARGRQGAALGKVLGGDALRHTSVSWGWGMGVTAGGAPTFPLLSCAGVKEWTRDSVHSPTQEPQDRSGGRLTPIF